MKLAYRNHIVVRPQDSLSLHNSVTYDAQGFVGKPDGFWYSIQDAWYKHIAPDLGRKKIKIYEVSLKPASLTTVKKPHPNRIVQIKTLKDALEFYERYLRRRRGWGHAMESFAGIEIHHPVELYWELCGKLGTSARPCMLPKKYHFLANWDVSSGCIWNLDVIRTIHRANYE